MSNTKKLSSAPGAKLDQSNNKQLQNFLEAVNCKQFSETLKSALIIYCSSYMFCDNPDQSEREDTLFHWMKTIEFLNSVQQ